MTEFVLKARVNQIVTKEVLLLVEAGSEEDAMAKAREALNEYPKEVTVRGIKRMVTEKSNYWIPRDIEFIKEEPEVA